MKPLAPVTVTNPSFTVLVGAGVVEGFSLY